MSQCRVNDLLEYARDRIRAWLPELQDCLVHDGRVDGAEIDRVAVRDPAVLVALLEVPAVEPCRLPEPDSGPAAAMAKLRLAAFAVCGDKDRDTSGWKRARAICERVALGIAADPWQLGFPRQRPAKIQVQNLFSGAQDKTGAALMAVAWEQAIEIEEPGAEGGPDRPLPSELYRGLAPETGPEHAGDYERIEGAPQ